jgi:hypothetical protein
MISVLMLLFNSMGSCQTLPAGFSIGNNGPFYSGDYSKVTIVCSPVLPIFPLFKMSIDNRGK